MDENILGILIGLGWGLCLSILVDKVIFKDRIVVIEKNITTNNNEV